MKKRLLSILLLIAMVFTMTAIGTTSVSAAVSMDSGIEFGLATHTLAAPFDKMPHTFEAVIQLPTTYTARPGVILGNYAGATDCISFELSAGGLPRLYYTDAAGTVYNHVFKEVDIRSDKDPVRLTMVHDADAGTITCYLNGEAKQTMDASAVPNDIIPATAQMLGGDYRNGNEQFFKGTIYKAAFYADALTADEVKAGTVNLEDPDLLAAYDFTAAADINKDISGHGYDIGGNLKVVLPSNIGLVSKVNQLVKTAAPLKEMPRTFEAIVKLPTTYAERAGVIVGNYAGGDACISFEISAGGLPRLYYQDEAKTVYNHVFNEVDMRSDKPLRLTLVQDPAAKTITCYINGEAKQTLPCAANFPDEIVPSQEQMIGGDFRGDNAQYFKGTIYEVNLYSDALTADQVASGTGTGLMASYDFTAAADQHVDLSGNGYDLTGELNLLDLDAIVLTEPEFTEGMTFDAAMIYQTGDDGYADAPYTYSAWVYLSKTVDGRGGVVIGNYQSGNIPCVSIEISNLGVPRFYHIDLNNKVTDLKFADADIRTGDWVHLAFTVSDVVTCYVNGDPVGEMPMGEFETIATEMPIGIGGDLRSGNAQYFKGRIREIALFEDPLTPMEIKTLYKDGAAAVDKDLVARYDLTNAEAGKDIEDTSGNGYTAAADPRFFTDKEPVGEYAYSFAFVGDTQIVTERHPDELSKIYDWLVANKDEKKIQYVFGLGDITNSDTDKEWEVALAQISKMDGVIPYSLVRGNHDSVAQFTKNFSTDVYRNQFEGFYEDSILNSWRTFKAGNVDYLTVTLDYGADDDMLNWASEVIAAHPDHRVIVTTHAYFFRDGSTLGANDVCPPSTSGGTNNGDDIWDKLISKHANIVLVVSGHDPCDTIVKRQVKGENGNTVTQMLIDPQGVDAAAGATGMVAMFYFSEDGNNIEVEYYSTVREKFFLLENQFTMTIPPMEVKPAETEAETAAPDTAVSDAEAADTEASGDTSVDEPAETAPVSDPAPIADKNGGSTGIIIGVIAAVVVIGAVVGVIIVKKKKNG